MTGYAGRILRVDLTKRTWQKEVLDPELALRFIGGRGFNAFRMFREIPGGTDPLSADNKLFFATGPLAGTLLPGARFNVSAKSPQTGIFGDSNAGGFFGPEMKFAGYDQIILEGKCSELSYLLITADGVQFKPAAHLAGMDVWQTTTEIRRELGDSRVQVACVGPAAENGVKFCGIFADLARPAARTGMGLVMASKNLKAIAVRGSKPITIADRDRFLRLLKEIDEMIFNHEQYKPRCALGTTRLLSSLNALGCLATRHYLTGRFEKANDVSGERLASTWKTKSKACFACTIPCSRFFIVKEGPYSGLRSEGPEFEGLAGFSSRVGNGDLGLALKGVDLCNRYGMDVISTSECISFAMECAEKGIISAKEADGLDLSWGNGETILTLIRKIAYREGFGDVLADGVRAAAEKIGRGSEELAMHVKGLEIFQADPRGLKGYALGLAVSSRGADHLRSEPSFEFSEDREEAIRRYGVPEAAFRLEYKGKGRLVKDFEERSALADCIEICKNTVVNMEVIYFEMAAALLKAVTGLDTEPSDVQKACERVVNLERCFNVREGLSRADDTLPRRFLEEPLGPECGPSAGSVVELRPMLEEYYEARGWDIETGIPTPAKLADLGLTWATPH
ncbi:MAG TPA: aldehyde ferredoxin oxidoreductase family protein [Firmicutes bacterium]|nr:aldehyde ferredoxin oxidoreductase family protein [Bacillota bacterium]